MILSVKEGLQAAFAERLAKRLHHLASISEEEYSQQAPISPQSLEDFVAFLRSTTNLVYPGVVLAPCGNIQAEWRKGKNRHFAVEFVGSGDVHFVVFAPGPKDPYKTIRASGMATVASLTDIVRPTLTPGRQNPHAVQGDRVPDTNHISRYCSGVHVHENGRISGTAFRLRELEEYLFVNWLESLGLANRDPQIAEIRNVLNAKGLKLGSQVRLAVLNSVRLREHVASASPDRRMLDILHNRNP